VVVSPDEAVLEIAVRRGVRPMVEEKGPLAGALRQVEAEAAEMTADALAVLPGDVAMVTPKALADALHTLGPVVMAEADGDGGTNLLLRRPPRSIPSRFGTGSFSKHLESASSRGLPVTRVTRPELSFDLDTARDAAQLLVSGVPGRTRECLLALGGDERLRAEGA
jgi:2-phospho-L-lactate guanylyltransferase